MHLKSAVISVPRYLYLFTCSNAVPFDFIVTSVPGCFSITITFVFFAINSMPKAVQLSFTLSSCRCNYSSVPASNTVSSANRMLFIAIPFTTKPASFCRASFISSSLYMLKNTGDKTQPCLTPFSILKL